MKATAEVLSPPRLAIRARLADFAELVKARLTLLVLLTTFVGFYLGSPASVDGWKLAHVLAGTALLAAGAATLNQLWERDRDARMVRTRRRPLPAGRIEPATALRFGLACGVVGLVWLGVAAGPWTAFVGGATLLSYLLIYTPLKTVTVWNTLIGAIPGALPPVIGWIAARDEMGWGGWLLFGLQFLWQIPHFLAIAWMYREDYARGGYAMLPVVDPTGRSTARHSGVAAALLLVAAMMAVPAGLAGPVGGAILLALTAAFLVLSLRFGRTLADREARCLFFGSILYLPALLVLLVLDRMI
ncbi:MAG: protoheme IX farnesyltransferase [Verrucomicrobia bacterium]|jgi:protoheme IX farnesyltransferase|nr:protoheme IX farnesyltransferase [Verrucomicrobiota bacterium]